MEMAKRLPNTWVVDAAQPQQLIQKVAIKIVWGQMTGSSPAASGQPDAQAPQPGGQP